MAAAITAISVITTATSQYGSYAPITHDLQAQFDAAALGHGVEQRDPHDHADGGQAERNHPELQQPHGTRGLLDHAERRRAAPRNE